MKPATLKEIIKVVVCVTACVFVVDAVQILINLCFENWGYRRTPLVTSYANRIPINQPNSPKSYRELLNVLRADKMTDDQKITILPAALHEVFKRAVASKDIDLLIVLWDSDIESVEINAKIAMFHFLPDERVIAAFSNGLNNPEEGIEYDSVQGIGELADLVHYNKEPPESPGPTEFENRAAYLIKEWREWWADNKEEILAQAAAERERLKKYPSPPVVSADDTMRQLMNH